LKQLSRVELGWAEAALGAIFPGSSEVGLDGIGSMDVRGFLESLCRAVPLKAALGLRLAVWVVALAPLFVLARFATIRDLELAEREALVGKLMTSPLYGVRSVVMILKTFGAMLYAGHARVRARLIPPRSPKLITLRAHRSHAA
jgi:hypothetical protein